MKPSSNEKYIYYSLRFASAMCFIGHGAFGIITKQVWCNYFAVFGIGHDTAYSLMPVVGTLDILMGVSLLFYPTRAVLGWLAFWGLITASLRPLSGEPFAEFIERAGNYGAPFTLFVLCGIGSVDIKHWFARVTTNDVAGKITARQLVMSLRVIVFLLLAGHGWLNLIGKQGLLSQYAALGFSDPGAVARFAGVFEVGAAFIVLIKPARPLIMVFLVWKIGTELLYPHWELFEWIERGGSYGAILALWFALPKTILPVSYQRLNADIVTTNDRMNHFAPFVRLLSVDVKSLLMPGISRIWINNIN
ncbi:MAG TPA: hypothetical protein VHE59_21700 [Mucilaginibacter sp.]|nr:hypothetical protein [Mucilaginibacter sp.]